MKRTCLRKDTTCPGFSGNIDENSKHGVLPKPREPLKNKLFTDEKNLLFIIYHRNAPWLRELLPFQIHRKWCKQDDSFYLFS